ncbi:hypothetical protein LCGC14_1330710, partial [marine sediment metagenome]
MALVLNQQLSNILRFQHRVEQGQISPQLAASQLGLTVDEFTNFQQPQRFLQPSDEAIEAARAAGQDMRTLQGAACGRAGQPSCFGPGQDPGSGALATVFDEVADEAPGGTSTGASDPLSEITAAPFDEIANDPVNPFIFQPQDPLQGVDPAPQLPLPSLSSGPRGFIPSLPGPDAGVGRRRLEGQLVRSSRAGGGASARTGGRRPGGTLQPQRRAPGDLV